MSTRKSALGPVPFWLSVAGALLTLVGLFWVNGLSRAFAQNDVTPPTITSISITSDPDENDADLGAYSIGRAGGDIVQSSNWASGVYRIGDDVQVTVMFSENVTITGSPQLELAIGSNNRTAEYESTDDSAVVFSYTVAEGDSDSDGIVINANKLTLNGGTIKDAADNDANLSHNALADQDGHKVDGIRPRIARFFLASSTGGSDGAYSEGEEMIIVAEFTEDHPRGSVTGPPQVKLDFDGEEKMARWDISLLFNSPQDYGIFGYVVQEGDLDSDGVTISANSIELNGGFIRDTAGNDAVLTHSAVTASSSFIVDAVAPTVSSITITSDPGDDDTYGPGDKIEVTVTFSENMSLPTSITCSSDVVHCKAELELDIGGTARTAAYESHDGAEVVYAYTVQAGDTDDNGISIGANKLTGKRIMDATGKFGYAINDADLSHNAVADDPGHKVSVAPVTIKPPVVEPPGPPSKPTGPPGGPSAPSTPGVPAAQAAPAAPRAPATPAGVLGMTSEATVSELPGNRLQIQRHDVPEASFELDIGSISADGMTVVMSGVIRDGTWGQTYFVVRRESDGRIVRRWVPPDSPFVSQIPWAVVNTQFTVPVGVLGAIPLDDQFPKPNMLTRRFDGGDDRILAYDAELGQWRHVPDLATFQALGFYWCNVTAADAGFFDRITLGPPYPASNVPARGDYPVCQT